jgi:hypothetical protein
MVRRRAFTRLGAAATWLGLFSVSALWSDPAEGQTTIRRVPVTVALVKKLPYPGVPAVILRRTDKTPRDVILLARPAVTGRQLAAAVFTLLVAREIGGDTASVSGALRVSNTSAPAAWRDTEQRIAERVVRRLLRAAARDVPGVGVVPAKDIRLRSGALRGKLTRSAR